MIIVGRRIVAGILLGMALALVSTPGGSPQAEAVDVGEPAPDFKLPSTKGVDISLSDFRGKKWVFLEFYGGDFHPT
jgi:peroxiredoxin Q/BCP